MFGFTYGDHVVQARFHAQLIPVNTHPNGKNLERVDTFNPDHWIQNGKASIQDDKIYFYDRMYGFYCGEGDESKATGTDGSGCPFRGFEAGHRSGLLAQTAYYPTAQSREIYPYWSDFHSNSQEDELYTGLVFDRNQGNHPLTISYRDVFRTDIGVATNFHVGMPSLAIPKFDSDLRTKRIDKRPYGSVLTAVIKSPSIVAVDTREQLPREGSAGYTVVLHELVHSAAINSMMGVFGRSVPTNRPKTSPTSSTARCL